MEIAQTDEHCFATKVRRVFFFLLGSACGQYGLVVASVVKFEIHMVEKMSGM